MSYRRSSRPRLHVGSGPWRDAIDKVEALGPVEIVAGHQDKELDVGRGGQREHHPSKHGNNVPVSKNNLAYEVFVNDPPPQDGVLPNGEPKLFSPMASTLIYGRRGAVLTEPILPRRIRRPPRSRSRLAPSRGGVYGWL
ncbi:MAG TPA: hypothetical protein VMJ65_27615 [Solirubrobacteraceae bacterium]|nr:hypothetical protein [Solirubrobacteraceae bacterium]